MTTVLAVFLTVEIVFLIAGIDQIKNSFPAIKAVMVTVAVIFWLITFLRKQKEKSERYQILLPISVKQLCFFRSLLLPNLWIAIFFVFWLGFIVFRFEYIQPEIFYDLLSMTGFILMISTIPLIHRDISNIFTGRFQKLILTGIYGFFMILIYLLFIVLIVVIRSVKHLDNIVALKIYLENLSSTLAGSLTLLCVGLILILISWVTFQRRKRYLD